MKDEKLEDNIQIVNQTRKRKEAPDSSFALIRDFQCCIFFLKIEIDSFQMLPHLLRDSYRYTNVLTVEGCCGFGTTSVTIFFVLFD